MVVAVRIRHKQYKGHDIRSSPRDFKTGWKIRVDIAFPAIAGEQTIRECLDDRMFSTVEQAHEAGFEYGYRIIDGQEKKAG